MMDIRSLMVIATAMLCSINFTGCSKGKPANATSEEVSLIVAPEKKKGSGPEGISEFYYVKENGAEWKILYSSINEFEYEPGYEYTLKALKLCNFDENIQDAPACNYKVLQIISKTKSN
jgi:hypothetical protein